MSQPGVKLEDIPWVFRPEHLGNQSTAKAGRNFFQGNLWDKGKIYYKIAEDITESKVGALHELFTIFCLFIMLGIVLRESIQCVSLDSPVTQYTLKNNSYRGKVLKLQTLFWSFHFNV